MTFLLVLLLFAPLKVKSDYVAMVSDLVEFTGGPYFLTEFSCNRKNSFKLIKHLGLNLHQVQVFGVNEELLPYPIPPHLSIFAVDLQCPNITQLLFKADLEKLFHSPYKWLLYFNKLISNGQEPEELFTKINILIDSEVTVMEKYNEATYILKKIFKRRESSKVVTELMGFWTKKNGVQVRSDYNAITTRRRKNLKRTVVNSCLVITHNDSLKHLTDKRDKHIDSIAKVNYVLVEHLSEMINISLNYSIQPTWGYKNNLSQWSGMIGELTRREADIGGTPLFLTSDRVDIIDYIAMTTPTRSKFVFRQPKLSYVTNVFTLPFHISVWISTIALGVIVSLVLFVTIKWEWFNKKEQTPGELHDSFSDVAFLTFGAVCQQGAYAIPLNLPGRITTIFLFISFMFLYTSYSANIVALLQSSSNSIQTLEDLLKSRLQVGVDDTVFNHFYFPNATEPIRRAIYLQKVAPPGRPSTFMQIEEGVSRMRQGLFAFHMETGAGYKIVSETFREDEKCGLQEIQYIQVPDPWMAIQKNSSYKELLKIGLHVIQESGLQFREVGLIYSKKPLCISRGSSFISVGLVDCYPAAVVWAGGLLLAFGIFFCEILLKKLQAYHIRIQHQKLEFVN